MATMTVKLTRSERARIAQKTRRELRKLGHDAGYGLDDARAYIEGEVEALGRFDNVPYTEISDYAMGLAAWICPREANEL